MSEQLPSDVLSRLRDYATCPADDGCVFIAATELLALVEIAEAAKSSTCPYGCKLCAAVKKLEAL